MHGIPILGELMIVLTVSLVVVYAFQLVRLPTIVGFLLSGMLVGPEALALVSDRASIETLAEIGVALLLFTVGLEFSLRDLLRMRLLVFGGGAGQLLLTIGAAALLFRLLGLALGPAVFVGALIALSSTAIVLRLLGERAESSAPHGRAMLGILIFQDLAVVPLILLVPLLSGQLESWVDLARPLGLAALVVVGMLLVATWAVPAVLRQIVRVRSRELFTLSTLAISLGAAYLTSQAGLSLALGAFMAGMVVSESEYAHQMLSEIAPMRDAFNSLFFVSIGMLMSPGVVAQEPLLVLLLVLGTILLKAAVAGVVALGCGLGARVSILVGLGLAQVGEFSFVLAHQGEALLSEREQKLFLAVSVTTMLLTPALLPLAHRLAAWLVRRAARDGGGPAPDEVSDLAGHAGHGPRLPVRDHVIVIGYGVNGRNVTRVLGDLHVPFSVLELNLITVEQERAKGVPIVYGDATRRLVLEHLHVSKARAVVISAGDAASCRQVVSVVRAVAPQAAILVRAGLMAEVQPLYALGATEVVAAEQVTSVELAGLVMATYGVTSHAIERTKALLREEQQATLQQQRPTQRRVTQRFQRIPRPRALTQLLAAVDVEEVAVTPGSFGAGKTLKALSLRARTGVSILVVLRELETIPNPDADLLVRAGDELVLCGSAEQIEAARQWLEHGDAPPPDAADELAPVPAGPPGPQAA